MTYVMIKLQKIDAFPIENIVLKSLWFLLLKLVQFSLLLIRFLSLGCILDPIGVYLECLEKKKPNF